MTAEEAENYEPPRSRKEQTARMWALWRLFSRDSLTNFLNGSSNAVKEVSARPTFTCFTPNQLCADNSEKGLDYFENLKSMDIFGYTCYCHTEGTNYFTLGTILDMSYSAAAIHGKKAWCIELDSGTKIQPRIFNKSTYATVGAGIAGIMYYQWRGDYPSEATPIPNRCGLVNYDGSKTANYENTAKMVKLINELSDYLVDVVKVHSGVGILFSDYASFYCDAAENDDNKSGTRLTNTFTAELTYIYTELRRLGYSVDIVNAEALKENRLKLKTLFVPAHARIMYLASILYKRLWHRQSKINKICKGRACARPFLYSPFKFDIKKSCHFVVIFSLQYMEKSVTIITYNDKLPYLGSAADRSCGLVKRFYADKYRLRRS